MRPVCLSSYASPSSSRAAAARPRPSRHDAHRPRLPEGAPDASLSAAAKSCTRRAGRPAACAHPGAPAGRAARVRRTRTATAGPQQTPPPTGMLNHARWSPAAPPSSAEGAAAAAVSLAIWPFSKGKGAACRRRGAAARRARPAPPRTRAGAERGASAQGRVRRSAQQSGWAQLAPASVLHIRRDFESLNMESQLFRRQRDASLAHLTPDEIAMHPRGHALLEAP